MNEEPTLFLYTHASNLDVVILLMLLPNRISYLCKADLLKVLLLGQVLRYGETVPIEREVLAEAKHSLEMVEQKLKSGRHVAIAPEGTRRRKLSDPGKDNLQEFKKGPFHVAKHTGVRLVPVLISGTSRIMGKGSSFNSPGTIFVRFLDPISSELVRSGVSYDELRILVRRIFGKNAVTRTDKEVLGRPGNFLPWVLLYWSVHLGLLVGILKWLFFK